MPNRVLTIDLTTLSQKQKEEYFSLLMKNEKNVRKDQHNYVVTIAPNTKIDKPVSNEKKLNRANSAEKSRPRLNKQNHTPLTRQPKHTPLRDTRTTKSKVIQDTTQPSPPSIYSTQQLNIEQTQELNKSNTRVSISAEKRKSELRPVPRQGEINKSILKNDSKSDMSQRNDHSHKTLPKGQKHNQSTSTNIKTTSKSKLAKNVSGHSKNASDHSKSSSKLKNHHVPSAYNKGNSTKHLNKSSSTIKPNKSVTYSVSFQEPKQQDNSMLSNNSIISKGTKVQKKKYQAPSFKNNSAKIGSKFRSTQNVPQSPSRNDQVVVTSQPLQAESEEEEGQGEHWEEVDPRVLELYEKYQVYMEGLVGEGDLRHYQIDNQHSNVQDLKIVIFAIFDKFFRQHVQEVFSEQQLREVQLVDFISQFINGINQNNTQKTVQQIFQIINLTDQHYFNDRIIFLFKSILLDHYSYKQVSFLLLVIHKINQLFFNGDTNQMVFNLWMTVSQNMFHEILVDIFEDNQQVQSIFKSKLKNYTNLKLDELIYRLLSIFINELDKSPKQSTQPSPQKQVVLPPPPIKQKNMRSVSMVQQPEFQEQDRFQQQIESQFYQMIKQIYSSSQNYQEAKLEKLFSKLQRVLDSIVEGIINMNKMKYFISLKIQHPSKEQLQYCDHLQTLFRQMQHSGYMQTLMSEFIEKILLIQEFQDIIIMEVINFN